MFFKTWDKDTMELWYLLKWHIIQKLIYLGEFIGSLLYKVKVQWFYVLYLHALLYFGLLLKYYILQIIYEPIATNKTL